MPQTDPALIEEARQLYEDGRLDEAAKHCLGVLESDPENDHALKLLGLCRRGQGELDGAIDCVRKALGVLDSDPESHFLLGEMQMESGRWEDARVSLEHALELDPNHAPARTAYGYLIHQSGDLPRAAQILRTALRADPDFSPALITLARVQVELGDVDEALRLATSAAEISPDEPVVQATLGRVFLAQGHYDFAERCYRNALDAAPENAEFEAGLAIVLYAAGRHREAEPWLRRALARGARDIRVVLGLAGILQRAGRPAEAREVLEQAYRDFPDSDEIALRLAEARLLASDPDAAGELAASFEGDDLRIAMLQARIAEAAGRLEEARNLVVPLFDAGHAQLAYQARMLMGRIALAERDRDEARAALEPMLAADPPDPTAVLLWHEVCEAAGDTEDARAALEDLLERGRLDDRQSARVHELLARLLDRSGDYAAAAGHLQRAGWRETGLIRRVRSGAVEQAARAWRGVASLDWETRPSGSELPDPMVVLGWPGSGRSLLLAALGNHPGVGALDPTREEERRRVLGIPLLPEQAADVDESDRMLARRRFLRAGGVRGAPTGLLDIAWWEMAALPALARFFPDSPVIVPEAAVEDLELYWRMAGYRDAADWREAYLAEQELFGHLRELLPLQFIPVHRRELLRDPETCLRALTGALGLDYDPRMLAALEQLRTHEPYREDGHWRYYADLLGRT